MDEPSGRVVSFLDGNNAADTASDATSSLPTIAGLGTTPLQLTCSAVVVISYNKDKINKHLSVSEARLSCPISKKITKKKRQRTRSLSTKSPGLKMIVSRSGLLSRSFSAIS